LLSFLLEKKYSHRRMLLWIWYEPTRFRGHCITS